MASRRGGQGLRMRDPEDGNLLAQGLLVVGFTITTHSSNAEMLVAFPSFPDHFLFWSRLSFSGLLLPRKLWSNLGPRRHLSGLQSLPNCHPCCRMLKKPPPARQPHFSRKGKWSRMLYLCSSVFFYLSTVDLQCCINFCCTAKWFHFTYVYIFFFIFFSILVYHRNLNIVLCAT